MLGSHGEGTCTTNPTILTSPWRIAMPQQNPGLGSTAGELITVGRGGTPWISANWVGAPRTRLVVPACNPAFVANDFCIIFKRDK